jgi:DNA-directed RNA polymerase specialized sigma24 family protein
MSVFETSSVSHPLPRPQADEPLRHGYTVMHVNQLAMQAVRALRWARYLDGHECLSAAHHAIIEHLYTCQDHPDDTVLIGAGMRAASRLRATELTQHGLRNHTGTTGPRFELYWQFATAPVRPADEDATERAAFWQIWRALDPGHRDTFTARAESASPTEAAQRLGVSRRLYHDRIRRARQQFLLLWHEGQTPSQPWRLDRAAADNYKNGTTITQRAFTRPAARPARPRDAGPARHRVDVGISGAELLNRYLHGQSLRSLAVMAGVSRTTITQRIKQAGYVPFSSRNTPPSVPPKDIGVTDQELLRLYQAGQSQAALAQQFGLAQATIHRRLRKAGHIPHGSRGAFRGAVSRPMP